ncbi:hypothetical protein [Streptococcus sp. E17BB]|uniref:hypothetical protein n=1 Tax=Streptococcus sp. E17BB TaxID=3278714 RepID=UPI00359ED10F
MSLNKTRKRAIARARRRLTSRVTANTSKSLLETSEQFLFLGYTAEQVRSLGRIAQAVSDGMVAFGKAFNESMERQVNEQTY